MGKTEKTEVGISEVKVLNFGLSPVIRLGLRNPRKKERKKGRHKTKSEETGVPGCRSHSLLDEFRNHFLVWF